MLAMSPQRAPDANPLAQKNRALRAVKCLYTHTPLKLELSIYSLPVKLVRTAFSYDILHECSVMEQADKI